MLYTQLYDQSTCERPVRVGVIGTGHFATATITQAQAMKRLDVPVVADLNVEAARLAYRRTGVDDEDVFIAESRAAALAGLENGKRVIVTDALLLMDLPLDVVVESTGMPEAGALHAREAVRHGKHVAMVNKETDATVGPILAQMAADAGLVYTPVDGDQHGLLMSLVAWARELGLEILSAGKARDGEYVYDPEAECVSLGRHTIPLDETALFWLRGLEIDEAQRHLAMRQDVLASLPQVGGFDLVEMAIVANATGLLPDRPLEQTQSLAVSRRAAEDARLTNRGEARENVRRSSVVDESGLLHCPPLHTREIPQVLCPAACGGVLKNRGVIDAVTSLRLPHEAGLGGGVFIVVACDNEYSRWILTSKGCLSNADGTAALIYRPYHLCGVETPITILNAALLGQSNYVELPRQRVDVVARTRRDFSAGETVGNDHSPDLEYLVHLTEPLNDDAPVPIHMANGNRLNEDVPAGTVMTARMIQQDDTSVLWRLRKQQDQRQFLT